MPIQASTRLPVSLWGGRAVLSAGRSRGDVREEVNENVFVGILTRVVAVVGS